MTAAPDVAGLVAGVLQGDRAAIGRAITLVESTQPGHRRAAAELLRELQSGAEDAVRVGITGVPGVGKSTFIDELGTMLTEQGHRVAVLAVDPSSTRTRGSVLGDKTRMERLANDDAAFIRPSPSSGTLGGVARATRQVMIVLEAAGYDVVIVETVGVGQSEVAVSGMVDTFLLLALGRSGDQLQGIKKGILELADVIAVNKADGEHSAEARKAARDLSSALRLLAAGEGDWRVPALTCSAIEGTGIAEVWQAVLDHRVWLADNQQLERRRGEQRVAWLMEAIDDRLVSDFLARPEVQTALVGLRADVALGRVSPTDAADQLLAM
jgi:LAO/AO transport system kinase